MQNLEKKGGATVGAVNKKFTLYCFVQAVSLCDFGLRFSIILSQYFFLTFYKVRSLYCYLKALHRMLSESVTGPW